MGVIVKKCRLCDNEIEFSPFSLCNTCLIEKEKVLHFIKYHPQTSLKLIAQSTKIPLEKVSKMVLMNSPNKSK